MINDIADFRPESVFATIALLCATAMPVTLIAKRLDPRQLSGDSVWSKPFKFAASLALHFATFALITRWMPTAARDGMALRIAALVSAAAGLFELSYISIQAVRGRHSHFNTATPVEAVMAICMGIGAILVLVPAAVIGVLAIAGPLAEWPLSVRIGVAVGFLGGAVLTFLTGMAMGAVRSHFAMGRPAESRRMRVTGWSLDGADLRPSHFLAAHMMQAVPVAAFLAGSGLPDLAASAVTALIGLGWGYLAILSYRSALAGRTLPRQFALFAEA